MMVSDAEVSIESLQLLLKDKDSTITLIKDKAKAYIEKINGELQQEKSEKQAIQDKVESAKVHFVQLREDKAALTVQLNTRTDELKVLQEESELIKRNASEADQFREGYEQLRNSNDLLVLQLAGSIEGVKKIEMELLGVVEANNVLEKRVEDMRRDKEDTLTASKTQGLEVEKVQVELQRVLQANKVLEERVEKIGKEKKEKEEKDNALTATKLEDVEKMIAEREDMFQQLTIRTAELSTVQDKLSSSENLLNQKQEETKTDEKTTALQIFALNETITVLTADHFADTQEVERVRVELSNEVEQVKEEAATARQHAVVMQEKADNEVVKVTEEVVVARKEVARLQEMAAVAEAGWQRERDSITATTSGVSADAAEQFQVQDELKLENKRMREEREEMVRVSIEVSEEIFTLKSQLLEGADRLRKTEDSAQIAREEKSELKLALENELARADQRRIEMKKYVGDLRDTKEELDGAVLSLSKREEEISTLSSQVAKGTDDMKDKMERMRETECDLRAELERMREGATIASSDSSLMQELILELSELKQLQEVTVTEKNTLAEEKDLLNTTLTDQSAMQQEVQQEVFDLKQSLEVITSERQWLIDDRGLLSATLLDQSAMQQELLDLKQSLESINIENLNLTEEKGLLNATLIDQSGATQLNQSAMQQELLNLKQLLEIIVIEKQGLFDERTTLQQELQLQRQVEDNRVSKIADLQRDLNNTKEQLNESIEDLNESRKDLNNSKNDVKQYKYDLDQSKENLEQSVKDLNDTKNNLSGAEEEVLKIKTELQSILEIKRVLEEQLEGMVREKEETLTTSKLEGLGIEKVQAELQRVLEANKVLERELEGSITKIEELVELKTSLSESLESTVESAVTIAIAAEVEINTVKLSTLAAEHAEALSFMEDTSRRTIQDKMESAKALFTQLKETIRVLTAKEEELSAQLAMTQEKLSEIERNAILSKDEASKANEDQNVFILRLEGELIDIMEKKATAEERSVGMQKENKVATVKLQEFLEKTKEELIRERLERAAECELRESGRSDFDTLTSELLTAKGEITYLKNLGLIQERETESSVSRFEQEIVVIKEERRLALVGESEKLSLLAVDHVNAMSNMELQVESCERNLIGSEKKLKDALSEAQSTSQRITHQKDEIQKLGNELGTKKSDLDATKANLAATTTAYSALSAQHSQLKMKVDHLTQQLESEVIQTQERKLKVRAYVDGINSEKREIEGSKLKLIEEMTALSARVTLLESQVRTEELKVQREESRFQAAKESSLLALEQQQQEHENQLEIQKGLEKLQKQETDRLQGLLDEHFRATAEEVQAAYKQMELSGKELESHKAKRLVARNEMIGAAQALERSQSEGQAIKAFIQYKLAPLVFEQVTAIEQLLSTVEHSTSMLSSKNNVRMYKTANSFLGKPESSYPTPDHDSPNHSPESSVSSNSSSTALTQRNGTFSPKIGNNGTNGQNNDPNGSNDGKSIDNNSNSHNGNGSGVRDEDLKGVFNSATETGIVRTNPSAVLGLGSVPSRSNPYHGVQTPLGEAIEQAEILRKELNRVHAGLSLLTHSVDRLGDVVIVDSKWCGGAFQMFGDSMTSTIQGSIRGSIGRTMVSHNNTSSSRVANTAPRPGLGYATLKSGDESLNSAKSLDGGSNYNKDKNKDKSNDKIVSPGTKNPVFSIADDDDDDEGDEIHII